jgi:hypothetical protein
MLSFKKFCELRIAVLLLAQRHIHTRDILGQKSNEISSYLTSLFDHGNLEENKKKFATSSQEALRKIKQYLDLYSEYSTPYTSQYEQVVALYLKM